MASYPLWTCGECEMASSESERGHNKRGQCQPYLIALYLPPPSFTILLDYALLNPQCFITMVKVYHAMAWDRLHGILCFDTQSGQ